MRNWLNEEAMALATQCLWSLQEAAPEIEGLLLTDVDGLTLTATMDGGDSMQRLAAISTTLFLLSEHTAEAWGQGESMEVHVTLSVEGKKRLVSVRPVGITALLTGVLVSDSRRELVNADLDLATIYLQAVLAGDTPPLPVRWRSR
ncbi:MAG: roadblock/LC7 domain-containing protein [Aggregatilineales bacterium]